MITLKLAGLAWGFVLEAEAAGVPLAVLSTYIYEGDNMVDGVAMAAAADDVLHLLPRSTASGAGAGGGAGAAAGAGGAAAGASAGAASSGRREPRWVPPSSWAFVYGSSFDPTLYI